MNKPKISIVVPVYNTEAFLSRCIDSILSQTFEDFELLLVDNGSTDGSCDILRSYQHKDERIRILQEKRKGVGFARNTGMEVAKGEWLYFCDSDDELFPDTLETLMSLTREDVDLVIGGYKTDDQKFITITEEEREMTNEESLSFVLYSVPYQGYVWTKLFHLSYIQKYHLQFAVNISFNEDRLFVVQYLCKCKGLSVYTPKQIYKYHFREGSAMSTLKKGFNPEYITDFYAFEQILRLLSSRETTKGNLKLAQQEFFKSFFRIRHMMIDHDCYDKPQLETMKTLLKECLGLTKWWYFRLCRIYFKLSFCRLKNK